MSVPRDLRGRARAAIHFNRTLLVNAGSIMGTAAVTSGVGVVFWVVAARYFSQNSVGVASAATSAMTLLGFISTLGLGTLLMGKLSRGNVRKGPLLSAALMVTGVVGTLLGLGFAVIAPALAPNFEALSSTPLSILFFAAGVGLTALAFVLDQALIGLMRGGLQLSRNVVFSIVKLIALVPVAVLVATAGPEWIYAVWTIGIASSLTVLLRLYRRRGEESVRPDFAVLHQMRSSALAHHLFNLGAKTPDLLIPVLVVAFVSGEANASFYTAWMIAGFIFTVPWSLSTVIFAIGAGESARLAERFRFSVGASLGVGLLANLVLLVAAEPLLSIFGPSYAAAATTPLQILALGVFGDTIKMHFIAVHRVQDRLGPALPIIWIGTALELGAASAGANVDGIIGVAVGWVAAVSLEGLVMSRDVFAAMRDGGVKDTDDLLDPVGEAVDTMPIEPI